MLRRKSFWFAVDVLLGLLVALTGLIRLATFHDQKPAVKTYGTYAITLTWPAKCNTDEDLYVRDPYGNVAYYAGKEVGGMHLESDDIPDVSGYAKGERNFERVVIRQVQPGEYTANVHVYMQYQCKPPTPVVVELWRLEGDDKLLVRQRLLMRGVRDEQTAFRATLATDGSVRKVNRLPRKLVG